MLYKAVQDEAAMLDESANAGRGRSVKGHYETIRMRPPCWTILPMLDEFIQDKATRLPMQDETADDVRGCPG